MYAIVEIAGQQFKVEEGKKIYVHRLDAEQAADIVFDRVLLLEDGDSIIVGEPVVKDIVVQGKVLEHVKGDKVIVFKKKRKKGYRVKNGHRQRFTQVEIISIGKKGSARKTAAVKEALVSEPQADSVETVKTVKTPVKEKKAETKKTVAKKASDKKETVEKSASKKSASGKTAVKKPAEKKAPAKKSPKGEK